jgi:ATP-dependent Clp protease adaptor protein ClpS
MARSQSKTIEKTELKFPDRFKVIIWNDDHTPMDFVVQLLVELFDKPLKDAQSIMLAIHNENKGVAGEYNFEVAEQKVHEGSTIARHNGYPLKLTMEKLV